MKTNDKKYTIYMHISPSMKKYIGITSLSPNKRWKSDGRGYKEQPYFWNAIQKYGWENFKHEILVENVTFEDACRLEQEFIQYYKTYDEAYGYNLTLGGEGRLLTDEQKKKLSEQRQGINACAYGHFPSEETKKKMSDAARNKVFTKNAREKMAYAETIVSIIKSISPEMIAAMQYGNNAEILESVTEAMAPLAIANNEGLADTVNTLLRGTSLEGVFDKLVTVTSK